MKNYDEICDAISKLYNENKQVQEIVDLLKIPRYLVELVLVENYGIYFR